MKNIINPNKYHSSGLYRSFYKTHQIDFCCNKCLRKKASYNVDLYIDLYVQFLEDRNASKEDNLTQEQKKEIIEQLFLSTRRGYSYFEPKVFCEETALKCGLLPFNYILCDAFLLAVPLPDWSKRTATQDLFGRLIAYQVLTHHTIDAECSFPDNKSYFEDVVGKDIVEQMEKILYTE